MSSFSALAHLLLSFFFFFNDTATTEIYTLSLHDALPIWWAKRQARRRPPSCPYKARRDPLPARWRRRSRRADRKSTRLNSSHPIISYSGFCLKKKTATRGCCTTADKREPR